MNKTINRITLGALAFAIALAPAAAFAAPTKNIVETAIDTPALSTLVSLVVQADLAGALQEPGPFTVFAPTNEAFEKLPKVVGLALEKDPSLLSKILLYHVVAGDIKSADIPRVAKVETLGGGDVLARSNNRGVFVNQSQVVIADVATTNGTVHVIDRVLIPWKEVAKSLSGK